MEKNYREIQFSLGCTVAEAVLELIKIGVTGKFVYGDFNGVRLYSDTVSLNSACLSLSGTTYFDKLNQREINRQRLIKEEQEYQNKVPTLVDTWVAKGIESLDSKYHKEWKRIVPIRLSDLYHGMELGATLDIIVPLNNNCSLEIARSVIDSQDHSGMSYNLVRSMVKSFCDRGEEFFDYTK
jgi:hypothetical protein